MNDDSGKHAGQRRIFAGRRKPRTALFQAANVAKQHNRVIKAFYAKLRSKGKPPLVAMIACARKLLVILDAMMRQQTDWLDVEKRARARKATRGSGSARKHAGLDRASSTTDTVDSALTRSFLAWRMSPSPSALLLDHRMQRPLGCLDGEGQ